MSFLPARLPLVRTVVLASLATVTLAACSSGSGSGTHSSAAGGASTAARTSSDSGSGSAAPSASASTAGTLAHLCTAFPKADAEQILGISLQNGVDSSKDCTYDRADSSEHLAVVTVALASGPDQPKQYEFNRSHPIGTDVLVDVSGVGDKAYYSPGFRMLVVLKGNDLLHISITDSSITNPQAVDTQIAQLVLAHLA